MNSRPRAGGGWPRPGIRGSAARTRAMVYQPMLELLGLLDRNGLSCWIFSSGGTDFMRALASEVYGLPPHG